MGASIQPRLFLYGTAKFQNGLLETSHARGEKETETLFTNIRDFTGKYRTQLSDQRHSAGAQVLSDGHFLEKYRYSTKHHGYEISD